MKLLSQPEPDRTEIIVGPPGTGKTTELLRLIDEYLAKGYEPEEIGLVSFTRQAADEAKTRAAEKFNLPPARFINFRTIHSMCFKQLGINNNEILRFKHVKELADILGLEVSQYVSTDEGSTYGMLKGDRLMFLENMARVRMIPLRQLWESFPDEDIDWWELERIERTMKKYKEDNFLTDYTDMLYEFLKRGTVPRLRVLFVDEAQDLSRLQWQIVYKLAEGVERCYVAGDDDQAIFTWAGADVHTFIGLRGRERVLGRSYRIPRSVHGVATSVLRGISSRREKVWESRDHKGSVYWSPSLDAVDFSQGSWLLLARNGYLLSQLEQHCKRSGFLYTSLRGQPFSAPTLEAIKTWERLRRGDSALPAQILRIYDHMSARRGYSYGSKAKLERANPEEPLSLLQLRSDFGLMVEGIWHEALDKIPLTEREYLISVLRRGERLTEKPRIRVSTIHGAKGGEAEHVLLVTDMAYRTYMEMQGDPDSEHRVWYVGTTRAKESLHLLMPTTNRSFEL